MKPGILAALTFSALFVAAAPVSAHHSFAAEYDSKQLITLKGVLTKVEWTNPHAYIYLDVKDESGKVTTWSLEGYPPNTLKRTGFARDLLKVGDELTVTAYKAKDATVTGAAREVTFPDGTKKFLGPEGR
ncbi:MAG TPA: DUF6152 family protein [Bryobacteraceae bacterium]|nr:DUF6152 family protein [Bryobacteraceae bacterium]